MHLKGVHFTAMVKVGSVYLKVNITKYINVHLRKKNILFFKPENKLVIF